MNKLFNATLDYKVSFPDVQGLSQGEEYFIYQSEEEEKKVKLHDYEELYQIPFLYDKVLYDLLNCKTPTAICDLFSQALEKENIQPKDLKILEIGAGSGIFGEFLSKSGFEFIAGLDIYPVAKEAAYRDRPGTYQKYYIDDLTKLKPETIKDIEEENYDCVAVASATGWGNHIPVAGFEAAFQLLKSGGWFIYHVKRDQNDPECIDLCNWIDGKTANGKFEVKIQDNCFHRFSIKGEPIYYDVIIGTKK